MHEKITNLDFDQVKIGMKKKFTVIITESSVKKFAELTGDFNPLHIDEKYANSTKFESRVCHGMFLGSLFSRLVGMELPGKNALYFSQSLNFKIPCFIGEEVTVQGEIIDKSLSTKMIKIKTEIHNKENTCIVDGLAKVILRQ